MFKPKKSLGQNFLVDKNIINKILSINNLKNQTVLEIGPGTGKLTDPIINRDVKKIILVEKDLFLYNSLKEKYKNFNNVKIYNKDILKYNIDNLKERDLIVFGNLPYNISSQILVNFIKVKIWPPYFKKIIFMFQKEVAERIFAKYNTKEFSRITVLANYRFEITETFNVSKNCFFPKPKVDSKVIVFEPKDKIIYKISNIQNLEKITNTFFSNRRKMINKPFSKIFKKYKLVANKLNIDLNLRPAELMNEDFYRITEYFENNRKDILRL